MRKRKPPSALAIGAHPDDIEFMMAGTLILLRDAGWNIHCMHLADGRCGTASEAIEEIVAVRQKEAEDACEVIGARYHEGIAADLQLYHTTENVARVVSVIRAARPRILLLHSPADYMTDHETACRIGVTAAFARAMPNFPCVPQVDPVLYDVTIYHAMPYGLKGPMRERVRPDLYVDNTSVMETRRRMLAMHRSQKEWLDRSQGADSYLDAMAQMCRDVGEMSGRFEYAEGWRRRLHLGFSATEQDPLSDALGARCIVDANRGARLLEGTLG
jgi:LmbE family N-acetylglucosaminyl deacetylase